MKTYNFTYRAEVKISAFVRANSIEEAREMIECGEFVDVDYLDMYNIDDICFTDEED